MKKWFLILMVTVAVFFGIYGWQEFKSLPPSQQVLDEVVKVWLAHSVGTSDFEFKKADFDLKEVMTAGRVLKEYAFLYSVRVSLVTRKDTIRPALRRCEDELPLKKGETATVRIPQILFLKGLRKAEAFGLLVWVMKADYQYHQEWDILGWPGGWELNGEYSSCPSLPKNEAIMTQISF